MITSFLYKKGSPVETDLSRARMLSALQEKGGLLWVDFENANDFEEETLVEIFNFHPLAVEDCITDHSQPKVDDYEEYLFLVVHAVGMHEKDNQKELGTVELNIFIGENYVVTFHRAPIPGIMQVKDVVQKKAQVLMGGTSDLLVHSILDHLVDSYLPVLHDYDVKIDALEKHMFENGSKNYLNTLLQIKQDIFTLRRVIAPQRDTLYSLTRNPTRFIKTKNLMYFRDVYDHLVRIQSMAESYQETLNSILQVYFSYTSTKLNEVTKRLTVLATITLPPVIIASIYGMNFRHMPELEWPFGYWFALALCAVSSVGMLVWMKLKKWI
ncbi:MAG: Magnesium transport protein CorA [Candidatus Omnitrophica bacterium ADurb.Bin277]|nr:MAG: Magnesium transport protein CorA [Candidatus Omnitrophica bacterium ADurb.Bin277]